jgi:hypothetical protein
MAVLAIVIAAVIVVVLFQAIFFVLGALVLFLFRIS